MNTEEKDGLSPDLAARIAALSPEKRALLERQLSATAPIAVAGRSEPAADVRPLSLSFAQQRVWFLEQLDSGHSLYNLAMTKRFSEPVDPQKIDRAINEVIRRHDSLRTTFRLEDGGPVQEIRPDLPVRLEVTDLEAVSTEKRQAEVKRRALAAARQPFDLRSGPLVRGTLLRLDHDNYVLVVTIHQIISDRWSLDVFAREFDSIYDALCRESSHTLPPQKIEYGEVILQQYEHLQGDTLKRLTDYWTRKLDGIAPLLDLPTDRARPHSQTFETRSLVRRYPRSAADTLYRLAEQQGATPFMALLALFDILLHRFSGISDIVVGTPVDNRKQPEQTQLIGLLADTLILRTDLSGNPSFREVLERVRNVAAEAYTHRDFPLQKTLEGAKITRTLCHNPLFQVSFSMDSMEFTPLTGTEFSFLDNKSSEFDISLNLIQDSEYVTATIQFNSTLFGEGTAASLVNAYGVLIESAVMLPDRPIAELSLVSSAARALLIDASATLGDMPHASTLHALFELQTQATPSAPALHFGSEIQSYETVDTNANKIARALHEFGIGPEMVVGLFMEKSPDWLISLLAVWKAGAAFLPLDPSYPSERVAFMLADANVGIILTQDSLRDRLPPFPGTIWCLGHEWSRIAELPSQPLQTPVNPDSLAYIIYTSGSTGWPKGVMVPHRCACNTMQTIVDALQLPVGARVLQFGSLSFDISIYDLLMTLGCGGTLCLAPTNDLLPGQPLADTLRELRINAVALPPSALNAIPTTDDLPDLHTIMSGGEALAAELAQRWSTPTCRVINGYGPTEATIWSTYYQCSGDEDVLPIGRAVSQTQAYVLDRSAEPLPYGFPGELYVGGAGVTRGYMNRSGLTAEQYIPDPFSGEPGSRLYRTGDRASLQSDGNIRFLGRIDNQIKLNGYRIELQEIESALTRHPQVTEAAVVVQRSRCGVSRLAAFCTVSGDAATIHKELLLYLRRHLPKYMVPEVFTILEELPVNASGKLDRQKLSEWTTPEFDEPREIARATEPGEKVAQIFAEILGVDRVSPSDSFFELGGHSLMAIRVIDRLNEAFLFSLTIRDLFENPVVADLVRAVTLAQTAGNHARPLPIPRMAPGTAMSSEGSGTG
ncbi:non-ribosomal peptide synthetase [Sinorhizobium meliloti]|nr:amino acid adenylation domain-containing protein [Sinorhizobium meliloti]WQP35931.1 amino acid adenylation domain-containing protein [Sinorhizobium meliloti]